MTYTVRGLVLGQENPSDVRIEDGYVTSVRSALGGHVDIGSKTSLIVPTLCDIQVNGVRGINLQTGDVTPEDVSRVADILAQWGVSQWIPTLVTNDLGEMERACRAMAEALQDDSIARAIPGIHLEGPYISPEDGPRGAHNKRYVRKPSVREFDRLLKAADGKIVYTTLAPERDGAVNYIKAVSRRGVLVALGHHNASRDRIMKAVDAGARLCTHLGNGLASQIPRHVNPLWPQLAEDRLAASLIPDLQHLPPDVLKTFVRVKGAQRLVFTSDCVHVALLKPGQYRLAGKRVDLNRAGRVSLSGTDLLAGSALMLMQGLFNAAHVTDLSLEQSFACATTNPARLFKLDHEFSLPRVGKEADFVVLDLDESRRHLPRIDIQASFVHGRRAK